jgi:metallo-beta-lactamase family protein
VFSLQISFWGAAREVTGSCYLLEGEKQRFLVDCGMFQGRGEHRNEQPLPFPAQSLDFVILTHAHLDHSGRIPLLVKEGFRGKIYATAPTIELCEILWLDTVKLMQEEADRLNRKRKRAGQELVVPLFGEQEVREALSLCEPVGYDQLMRHGETEFVLRNAAHILGAALVELWCSGIKLVFSGDLGPFDNVMEGSPPVIEEADYVIVESTYGNRRHRSLEDTRSEFKEAVLSAQSGGGKVLIPSFVVDRAQRIVYELSLLKDQGLLDLPCYFDSPMGEKATRLYEKYLSLLSGEIERYVLQGRNPFHLSGLKYVSTPEDSKSINDIDRALVIAGSGMCNGGRIVHHLKHALWRENTSLIFVGYQAQGTLGRRIVDGARLVRILGEEVAVRAKVYTINGFSAHADQKDLLRWTDYFKNQPLFVVVHGEESVAEQFALLLREKGRETLVPHFGERFDLVARETVAVPSEKTVSVSQRFLEGIMEEVTKLQEEIADLDQDTEALVRSAYLLLREATRRKNKAL